MILWYTRLTLCLMSKRILIEIMKIIKHWNNSATTNQSIINDAKNNQGILNESINNEMANSYNNKHK